MKTRGGTAVFIAALALALVLTACSYTTEAEARDEGVGTLPEREAFERLEPAVPDPTVTLPAPEVEAGGCQVVTYTPPTADEEREADLCVPGAARRRDVGIVLVHGGGGIGGNRTGVAAWADHWREQGYVTLAIDYTLFTPGTGSPVFPHPEQNTKAAVQYLRGVAETLEIHRDHIVVQGFSAGARLGAVAYTTPGDPWFEGPELWPGIDDRVDAFAGFYSTYDGTMQYDDQYYGGPRDDPDPEVRAAWAHADSIVNATRVVGPAALFTGALDWNELIVQQDELSGRVEEAGYESFTFVVDGAEHGYDSTTAGLTESGEIAAAFLGDWFAQLFSTGDDS